MATATIGTAGTFTTIPAWYDSLASTLASPEVGQLLNQTHALGSTPLAISKVTSPTNTLTLECAAGASFKDHASKATNPLRPSSSYGAIITFTGSYVNAIACTVGNVILRGLQVDATGSRSGAIYCGGDGSKVEDCIVRGKGGNNNENILFLYGPTTVGRKVVVIDAGVISTAVSLSNGATLDRATILRTADQAANGTGVKSVYGTATARGVSIFNFAAGASGNFSSSSDYNATNLSSVGTGQGTHNLASLTATSCIVNTGSTAANVDPRIKAASPLIDAGVAISGITADVLGVAIPQGSAPDIGADEYASAASPATAYTAPLSPTTIASGATTTATVTPNGTYTGTITGTPSGTAASGLSPVVLTFSSSATPQTASWTPTVAGTLTIAWTNNGGLTNPANGTVTVNAVALSVSAISCTVGRTSLAASVTASGGTAPYTYTWSQSATLAGTYTAFGTNSNSATLSGLAYRTARWLKCVVADSAGSPATVTAGPTGFATRPAHSPAIGLGGDSITQMMASGDLATMATNITDSVTTSYAAIPAMTNVGISGSTTADWLPSAANWSQSPISGASNIYAYATTAFASGLAGATVKIVTIMLGTNDAANGVAAATYGANLRALCNALVALGYRVMLHYPPYRTSGASADLLVSYQGQIDAIVDNVGIFQGDQDAFALTLNNPSGLLSDGIHPSSSGKALYGKLWADAIVRMMEREGRTVASGSTTIILANGLNGGFQ